MRAAESSAAVGRCRLEHCIPLLAGFDDFPRPFEAGGHDERVTGAELMPVPTDRFDAHGALEQHAQIVFRIADPPLAASAAPPAADNLPAAVGVLNRLHIPRNVAQ